MMVNPLQGRPLAAEALTGPLVKAARVLSGLSAQDLADRTRLGIATIKRAEASPGPVRLTEANARRIIEALGEAGVTFVDEGDAGVGVHLTSRQR